MRSDTLPLLALKPETLFKRSAKTDAFVPRTAGSKDDLNDEFKTLASMDAWEQPFVTPPGVVQEVQTSASGGGAVRLTQIQDAASKDYINRWMNARPETIGVQYDDKVGKNDGMLHGKRYFTCPSGHGGFLRSSKVTAQDEFLQLNAAKAAAAPCSRKYPQILSSLDVEKGVR